MTRLVNPQIKAKRKPKLSRQSRPADMSLEQWQIELRREYGRQQDFRLKNVGEHPIFSEFQVSNPQSKMTYRVVIRGNSLGENHCTCGDFATNLLGTCKHIEFTLGKLEDKRGARNALQAGYQPPFSEVILHYGPQRELRFRPGAECPVELSRLTTRFFEKSGVLRPEAFATFDQFLARAGEIEHELRCREDVLGFIAEVRDSERREKIIQEAYPRGIRSAGLRDLLKVPMYDYQSEGALFAARSGRCLIGDEMGLGKTIQAIAAAELLAKHLGVERVLVICPTSLKHQWEREIERFAERQTQVIGGARPMREVQFQTPAFFKIMDYDTVHADLDLIQSWAPELVILDEAQRIKNWNTRVARSVKRIQSPYAIVLTGTPLENRLEELVSIVQFVDRFRLGPTYRLLSDHQLLNDDGKVIGYRDLDRIGKTLAPVLLRRQKDMVLGQLPKRIDNNIFVPMTEQQRVLHDENKQIVSQIVMKWRRYKFLSEADQRRLMICLQNMRMSCDSTYLLDQTDDHGVKADELLTVLEEILETPDAKVVLFSQWLRMHELIVERLEEKKIGHVLFHGGVPGPQRKSLVDRFRDEPECRVFLATDAGGVGLNLQFASVVINMDLPWNPAVLEQRIGRVHRLGQKRPVQVINFVAQGTIEEGMLGVLQFKKSLFAGVLDGGEKEVFLGGSRLTKFMETVEKTTTSIPRPQAERPESEARAERDEARGRDTQVKPAPTSDSPWAGLLQGGLALLQQLATPPKENGKRGEARYGLVRDERTGERYVKLPAPPPELLGNLTQMLASFARMLQG